MGKQDSYKSRLEEIGLTVDCFPVQYMTAILREAQKLTFLDNCSTFIRDILLEGGLSFNIPNGKETALFLFLLPMYCYEAFFLIFYHTGRGCCVADCTCMGTGKDHEAGHE